MSFDRIVSDYEYRLNKLRIWPEKSKIFDLTAFAEQHENIANHIADILISRIIDPLTGPPLKVPLFYLVDSILKNVGGPYVQLFSSHIVEVFGRVFNELNGKDKARLDFMLSTWEESLILPKEILVALRTHIGSRIVCVPVINPIPSPHFRELPDDRFPRGAQSQNFRRQQDRLPPTAASGRGGVGVGGNVDYAPGVSRGVSRESPSITFKQNVEREMLALLDYMYKEVGVADRIPLQDLRVANPALFHQILLKAEDNVTSRDNSSGSAGLARGGGNFAPGHFKKDAIEHSLKPIITSELAIDASIGNTAVPVIVHAFINEIPVTVDVSRAHVLATRLQSIYGNKLFDEKLRFGCGNVAKRLSSLLNDIHTPPDLPDVVLGSLPSDILLTNDVESDDNNMTSEMIHENDMKVNGVGSSSNDQKQIEDENLLSTDNIKKKLDPVPFKVNELNKNPKHALQALYIDRKFVSRQDGLRFLSQKALGAHLDALFVRNRGRQRKDDRDCRSWYCTIQQWVTDFNMLIKNNTSTFSSSSSTSSTAAGMDGGGGYDGPYARRGGTGTGATNMEMDGNETAEEMVVPADEQFPRCPVSNEAFVQEWDEEEGDYVYRNAVKVLVTEAADPNFFKLAKPTIRTNGAEIRYAIVHKLLVLDGWLASKRVVSLQEATQKLHAEGRGGEAAALALAAGEEEDEEDVFVLTESPEVSEKENASIGLVEFGIESSSSSTVADFSNLSTSAISTSFISNIVKDEPMTVIADSLSTVAEVTSMNVDNAAVVVAEPFSSLVEPPSNFFAETLSSSNRSSSIVTDEILQGGDDLVKPMSVDIDSNDEIAIVVVAEPFADDTIKESLILAPHEDINLDSRWPMITDIECDDPHQNIAENKEQDE